jgi:hypothetical protein
MYQHHDPSYTGVFHSSAMLLLLDLFPSGLLLHNLTGFHGAVHYESNLEGPHQFSGCWTGQVIQKLVRLKILIVVPEEASSSSCNKAENAASADCRDAVLRVVIRSAVGGVMMRGHVETDESYIKLLLNHDEV